jgi:phosphonate transport system ATP-binding protein
VSADGAAPDVLLDAAELAVGATTLLGPVSLAVPRGQRIALIGPSGAGKTSLLRLCAGLAWPSRGRVEVLAHDTGALRGRDLRAFRRRVGLLHQQDNLVPALRVAHNVLIGRLGAWSLWRSLWSFVRPQELELAAAALERVELRHRLWALPDELSGGEQQRVAIARLVLQEPEVLLADEPASSLDVRLARDVVQLLLSLPCARGTTIVSLHSLDLLDLPFDRVLALRGGRIVFDGPPASLDDDVLLDVFGPEAVRERRATAADGPCRR